MAAKQPLVNNGGTIQQLQSADYIPQRNVVGVVVPMAAANIDLSAGDVFTKTVSGSLTLTISNYRASGLMSKGILELTNPGTNVTFPSGSKWAAGSPPTFTVSGKDVLGFYSLDGGTTITWLVLGQNVS
jgi:hypothetical protein